MSFGRQSQKQSNVVDATTTTSRDFSDPNAQRVLQALMGQAESGQAQQAGAQGVNVLSGIAGQEGVNPFIDEIIANSNVAADRQLGNRLAQTRAAGFRGGIGTNLYNQGKLVSDFTNQQALQNNQLRAGAFDANLARRMNAAQALMGQGNFGTASNQQLLQLLAGQRSTEKGTTSGRGSGTSMGLDVGSLLGGAALAKMAW